MEGEGQKGTPLGFLGTEFAVFAGRGANEIFACFGIFFVVRGYTHIKFW